MIRSFEIANVTMAQLRDAYPEIGEILSHDDLYDTVGAVTSASRFLTRLILVEPRALEVLRNLDTRPTPEIDDVHALVTWKRLELLRIAARDLTQKDELEAVGANLALLAEDVLHGAARLAGADDTLIIIGMGKLGGSELNYASDIDIMFAGDCGEEPARKVMEIARRCFRVDAALRPEGRDGMLVRSLAAYQRYWDNFAQTWEFQALLKARTLTGPTELQTQWTQAADTTLWNRPFGATEIRTVRMMKERVENIINRKGLADLEVKRGRGGIRDIEFAVQLLQLVHGGADSDIRSATTLTALQQLATGGYVSTDDAHDLAGSYRFLRAVEHRLQLVEEEQTHTIPTGTSERGHLAITLGYEGPQALVEFDAEMRDRQAAVRHAHEKLYFRPLLEAFAAGSVPTGSTIETQLAAFGFMDANRTRTAVAELTKGLARSFASNATADAAIARLAIIRS